MEQRKQHLRLILLFLLLFLSLRAYGVLLESSPPHTTDVTHHHFVLIHGSCHGAWSWYKIIALLKSSSQNVTAIDLAASGVDPRPVKSVRSVSDYHRPLMDFMASLRAEEKVILVGHSSGGLAMSQAMEMFPHKVSVAVFVTAVMPGPNLNISTINQVSYRNKGSLMDSRYGYDNGPKKPPTTLIFGPLFLSLTVYHLSPIQDWALATTLMRPSRLFSEEDLSKETGVTRKRFGSVNRVFVISDKDEVMKRDFQVWMIRKNPPHEVVEIFGSDHMVMISKPMQLWAHLMRIARKYQ